MLQISDPLQELGQSGGNTSFSTGRALFGKAFHMETIRLAGVPGSRSSIVAIVILKKQQRDTKRSSRYQAAVSCWKCPNCTCNDPAMYWHIDNIWQYLAIDHTMTMLWPYYDHIMTILWPYYDHIMTILWLNLPNGSVFGHWGFGEDRSFAAVHASHGPLRVNTPSERWFRERWGARRVESSVWNGTCGVDMMVIIWS
jgi:hypothetical protein